MFDAGLIRDVGNDVDGGVSLVPNHEGPIRQAWEVDF
jgi:hypothetical protein